MPYGVLAECCFAMVSAISSIQHLLGLHLSRLPLYTNVKALLMMLFRGDLLNPYTCYLFL
jgi:hypothetical protein